MFLDYLELEVKSRYSFKDIGRETGPSGYERRTLGLILGVGRALEA